MNRPDTHLQIRIVGVDGSQSTFTQDQPKLAQRVISEALRPDFFARERVIIAGQSSLTTFTASKIARIDLTGEGVAAAKRKSSADAPELIEISEQEFFCQAEERDLKHSDRRLATHVPGEHFVSLVDIQLFGGKHVYLNFLGSVTLPAERLRRVHSFLSVAGLSFKSRGGGLGIVNLGNVVKTTAYPGPPEVPADTWLASESKSRL